MSNSTARCHGQQQQATMGETLAKARSYMQSGDYPRAVVLLQRARNMCTCIGAFREKHGSREHSSAKACLRGTLLSAALREDEEDAVYKAATSPCSCGVPKLTCDNATHMDVLDKMAACSGAMGKSEAAVGFAAAAIHLDPRSPVGYCRLSKLVRTRTLDEATLRSDLDSELMASAIVRHGVYNVKTYGNVEHPLYQVLHVISKKLYRKDPLKVFPPELKVMILSQLDTLELVRCQRVSKRWLFAIRDDPNLWQKLVFVFTSSKGKPSRLAKGMLRVISSTKRASTLSIAPAVFDAAQYQLIFSQLKDLRHLHIESQDGQFGIDEPCAEPPRHLTRFTLFGAAGSNNSWFRSVLTASASTLEEMHIFCQIAAITCQLLPRLRILRIRGVPAGRNTFLSPPLLLELLAVKTPNLEQLCLEETVHAVHFEDSSDNGEPGSYLWPQLKVLVIGAGVTVILALPRNLVPPGVRVLDIHSRLVVSSMFASFPPSIELAGLEHLRIGESVEPQTLRRILAPSLANGNLKTLSLAWNLAELHKLDVESQHIQALGLAVEDFPKAHTVAPAYLDWVARFPNAHTFAVEAGSAQVAAALGPLMLRPGTKRVFESSLQGVERDQLLEEARARKVEVIRSSGFPVIFPWRLDDGNVAGGGAGQSERAVADVVEQWHNGRGRISTPSSRVCNQPFFCE